MITVSEAKSLIESKIIPLEPITIEIAEAYGYCSFEDIHSPIDQPPCDQSSMDGYAFRWEDVTQYDTLKVIGSMPAGAKENVHCLPGTAIRIFTGAPMPSGADTVVIQEKVELLVDHIKILHQDIDRLANVRPQGSEVKKGTLCLPKMTKLTPAAIGFLASVGLQKIKVFRKPQVALLVTGDELIEAGAELGYGQIFESNSYTVKAFFKSIGIDNISIYKVKDNLEELVEVLSTIIKEYDLIILTGGVSVGDFDFVQQATKLCGIEEVFHKVKQKPGKPLFFGKFDTKPVFGLPGNPTSVLTCLYQYVYIAVHACAGQIKHLNQVKCKLTNSYKKAQGMKHFLKGHFTNNEVTILQGQESYKLGSYALSNCLVEIDEDTIELQAHDLVNIYLLP
jgi:molybdopterin molybdotransferase